MTLGSASSLVPPRTRAQWVDDRLRDEILVGRIAPGERVLVDLSKALANRNEASLSIVSDLPVVVGQLITTGNPVELIT
ncbi:MAG: hypothetical protein EBZ93_09515, partial [Actinobacteria bacterium]|nr:hypothetical protein [Actinomycetota bacterium]